MFGLAKPLACSWWLVALSAILSTTNSWSQSIEKRQIVGAVTEQKKYSIRVATSEGVFEVHLPSSTPVEQQLERPQFDWENRLLRMELLASARDGDPHGNLHVDVPLPEELYLDGSFAHRAEFTRLWNDKRKGLVRYRLTKSPQESHSPTAESLTVQGKILESKDGDQVALELNGQKSWVRLGDRAATLDGFSIQDLKSHETDVDLEAHRIDNRWVAQTVKFRRTVDARQFDRLGLPRLLSLGDEVSVGWHRSLCSELAESFNCHHPPEAVDGSDSWIRLGCWLGDYQATGRAWDVIAFNVAPANDDSREKYQANLQRWIQVLKQTKARLIWVPAVTVNKSEASRYGEANEWAKEFLGAVPEVELLAMPPLEENAKPHLQIANSLRTAISPPGQNSNPAK